MNPLRTLKYKSDIKNLVEFTTRWTPRKIKCVDINNVDNKSELYVVKLRRRNGNDIYRKASAMCISEVVATSLINEFGIKTPEPALIYISDESAQYYSTIQLEYSVLEGYHYGTKYIENLLPYIGDENDCLNPMDIVKIWILDSWLANIDRNVRGNLMYLPVNDKVEILAMDQSDCFAGAGTFCDGNILNIPESKIPIGKHELVIRLISSDAGISIMGETIEKIINLSKSSVLDECVALAHEQWWEESGIDSRKVISFLRERANNLNEICDYEDWKNEYKKLSGYENEQLHLF